MPSFPFTHPYWDGTPQLMLIHMTVMLARKSGYRRFKYVAYDAQCPRHDIREENNGGVKFGESGGQTVG